MIINYDYESDDQQSTLSAGYMVITSNRWWRLTWLRGLKLVKRCELSSPPWFWQNIWSYYHIWMPKPHHETFIIHIISSGMSWSLLPVQRPVHVQISRVQLHHGPRNHGDHQQNLGDGLPAYSHHDKISPWWGNVSNDKGGNVSVSNSHHTWKTSTSTVGIGKLFNSSPVLSFVKLFSWKDFY